MVWGRSFSGSLLKGAGLGAYALGQDQTMQIAMDIWLKAHHSEVSLSARLTPEALQERCSSAPGSSPFIVPQEIIA